MSGSSWTSPVKLWIPVKLHPQHMDANENNGFLMGHEQKLCSQTCSQRNKENKLHQNWCKDLHFYSTWGETHKIKLFYPKDMRRQMKCAKASSKTFDCPPVSAELTGTKLDGQSNI